MQQLRFTIEHRLVTAVQTHYLFSRYNIFSCIESSTINSVQTRKCHSFWCHTRPSEPSPTINTYLGPLVSELLQLWEGVQLKLPMTDERAMFRCALLGIACDLPAARKVSGFLSHSANLGCSRCFEKFSRGFHHPNRYDNFDRDKWTFRNIVQM